MIRMSTSLSSIILLAFSCVMISAMASCPTTLSLDTFLCKANEEYYNLQLIGEVEILTGAPAPDTEGFGEEAKKRIKPFLAKAKSTVFFNTRAGEALNDFYVYWITIINDSHPRTYEDLSVYQQRGAERYAKLQEKANQLRISLE
ncbi:exported hypothetical protein [Gammaproteobacteria bacterium]